MFDAGRLIIFGPDLRHVRTVALAGAPRMPSNVVRLGSGRVVALTSEFFESGPRPIRVSEPGQWAMGRMAEPKLDAASGPARTIAAARNRGSGTFWVAQHAPSEGKGYDLLLVNADGKVFRAVQRHPSWWVTDKIEWLKPNPTSRVVDIREVADGIVVVALAHPRPDWKRFPIQPNGNGSLRRYFTRVDVIDTRTAEVIGTVDVPGYPRRLLDDRRIASYVEDEDGIPYLDVWAYSFRR